MWIADIQVSVDELPIVMLEMATTQTSTSLDLRCRDWFRCDSVQLVIGIDIKETHPAYDFPALPLEHLLMGLRQFNTRRIFVDGLPLWLVEGYLRRYVGITEMVITLYWREPGPALATFIANSGPVSESMR